MPALGRHMERARMWPGTRRRGPATAKGRPNGRRREDARGPFRAGADRPVQTTPRATRIEHFTTHPQIAIAAEGSGLPAPRVAEPRPPGANDRQDLRCAGCARGVRRLRLTRGVIPVVPRAQEQLGQRGRSEPAVTPPHRLPRVGERRMCDRPVRRQSRAADDVRGELDRRDPVGTASPGGWRRQRGGAHRAVSSRSRASVVATCS